MVILGTAGDGEKGECTTLTLAPATQADGVKTIRRKCRPGTVLLLRGRSSWSKWTYAFDSPASMSRYYRVCFFRVDPLMFPVHNKPYRGGGIAVNQHVVVPVLGLQHELKPNVENKKKKKEEEDVAPVSTTTTTSTKDEKTSRLRVPSTFKKRKTDKK